MASGGRKAQKVIPPFHATRSLTYPSFLEDTPVLTSVLHRDGLLVIMRQNGVVGPPGQPEDFWLSISCSTLCHAI